MFDFEDERPLTEEEYQQLKSEIEDCTDGYSNFDLACLILTMENLKILLEVTKTMYDLELSATRVERDILVEEKDSLIEACENSKKMMEKSSLIEYKQGYIDALRDTLIRLKG